MLPQSRAELELSEEEVGGFLPGLASLARVCVLFIAALYNGEPWVLSCFKKLPDPVPG